MHYNEILGRWIVAEVARTSVDGGALPPVLLHEVVCRLKIDEAWAGLVDEAARLYPKAFQ